MTEMTYDQIAGRLIALARANGGVLTADQAEQDPMLASANPAVVAAAARALDGSTNIFGTPRTGEGWYASHRGRLVRLAPGKVGFRSTNSASPR